jgi:DNA replication protein DnaC
MAALHNVRARSQYRTLSEQEIEARQKRDEETKRREAAERSAALWAAADAPPRFKSVNLDKLPDGLPDQYHQACGVVRTLLKQPAIMCLIGSNGTGKTAIACGLIRDFCLEHRRALYCKHVHYFDAMKSTFCPSAKMTLEERNKTFFVPELLVVDEFGEGICQSDDPARDVTQFERRRFTTLVDDRDAAGKSTVIISNLGRDRLLDALGTSVESRLKKGGIFPCHWEDLRGRNLKTAI